MTSSTCSSPRSGPRSRRNGACAEVESTKSVSDIYSPLSGTVVEVNESLGDTPEQLNSDPYGTGWIFVVQVSDPAELDALLDAAAYRTLIETA